MTDPNSRSTDPGVRLWQLEGLRFVHCPRCDGPARQERERLTCLRCPYREGEVRDNPRRIRRVVLKRISPTCSNPACGAPIPREGRPVSGGDEEEWLAEVKCPTCGKVGRYPAVPVEPFTAARAWSRVSRFWRGYPLYLHRKVGGHDLLVYNAAHLDMLEQWLGAKLRERGPSPGLTMMARLPRWMKAAKARPEVLKALADIREQAKKEGLF